MIKRVAVISSAVFLGVCALPAQSSPEVSAPGTSSTALLSRESPADLAAGPATGFVFDGRLVDALEFFKPHKSANGRSCATCHRPEDNFALTPATVEARYQSWQARRRVDPMADDPLFRSIDADVFNLDFTTLRSRALVRVVLPLPSNITLADDRAATSDESGNGFFKSRQKCQQARV